MLRPWATDRPTLNKLTLLAVFVMATAALMAPPLARAADPVVAAAGNIACDPASPYFAGGAGTAANCHQSETAGLLPAGLSAVLPLGDAQYCCGTLAGLHRPYDPTWGAQKAITRPVPATVTTRPPAPRATSTTSTASARQPGPRETATRATTASTSARGT